MSEDDHRIHAKPGHLIRRLQQISVAIFMDQTRKFDITPVQYAGILAIQIHPGIDQTTLCNIIAFDRSTIGDVVTRLEAKGLIRRLPNPTDRRTKLLYVTPAGRRLIGAIEPAIQSAQRRILAPLGPDERTAFMQMLQRLVHINNEHSRAPVRPKDVRPRRRSERAGNPGGRSPAAARARARRRAVAD
jgi:MarR family transcriptional regulator, lower aerobic nicotinate degradation pathway regulator